MLQGDVMQLLRRLFLISDLIVYEFKKTKTVRLLQNVNMSWPVQKCMIYFVWSNRKI